LHLNLQPTPVPVAEQPAIPAVGAAPVPASQPTPEQQSGEAPAAGPRPDIAQLLASIGGAA
jgi:hypothetical protein